MTTAQDLLIEIGTEELPAKHQLSLAESLSEGISQALNEAKLSNLSPKVFATPRRIGIVIEQVESLQSSQQQQKLGPNIASAYDSHGMPSLACIGFAKSVGVSIDQLETIETPKGQRVGVTIEVKGKATTELLPSIIDEQIKKLLSIGGTKTVDEIHKELGRVMWDNVGMSRTKADLEKTLQLIPKIKKDFWNNVKIPGTDKELNPELEKAGRLADFIELGELMARDALHREESCGGHFREESQTPEGEAKRDDENFCHANIWEYQGDKTAPTRNRI